MNPNPPSRPPADVEARQILQQVLVNPVPRLVEFRYTAESGGVTQRKVEPYELKGDELIGHCLERDAIRRFKLARMENIEVGDTFRPRHPIKMPC